MCSSDLVQPMFNFVLLKPVLSAIVSSVSPKSSIIWNPCACSQTVRSSRCIFSSSMIETCSFLDILLTILQGTFSIPASLAAAKLDQDELKNKEQDKDFQLSLKDLYELERIKDVEERNKILREATDNRNLVAKVQSYIREKERQ